MQVASVSCTRSDADGVPDGLGLGEEQGPLRTDGGVIDRAGATYPLEVVRCGTLELHREVSRRAGAVQGVDVRESSTSVPLVHRGDAPGPGRHVRLADEPDRAGQHRGP